MTIGKFMLILITVVMVIACHRDKSNYYDNRLTLVNKSSKTISAYYNYAYPDTGLGNTSPIKNIDANHQTAEPGSTIRFVRGGSWETAYKEQIHSGKLILFVFDDSALRTTPWDTIAKKYSVLKRYELSLQNLQNSNWTVVYP